MPQLRCGDTAAHFSLDRYQALADYPLLLNWFEPHERIMKSSNRLVTATAKRVIFAALLCFLLSGSIFGEARANGSKRNQAVGVASAETENVLLNLRNFGAVGDGIADDGPALQAALDALGFAGGGTLYVPPGHYAIATSVTKNFFSASSIQIIGEPSSTPIHVAGNGTGLDLTTEFIIKVGPATDALTIRGLDAVIIKDIAFVGVQEVFTDARITINLGDVGNASIEHCEFYGLASFVEGGAIVFAYRTGLSIKESAFLGCATSSATYTSIVQNLRWKRIEVRNSKFIDFGNRPDFYSKTPYGPPLSWVSIGNAEVLTASSSRREAIIQNAFMDEGAYLGISSLPDTYESPSAVFDVYISQIRMNVNNLMSGGVHLQGAQRVLIERSHFGWSHNADSAIELLTVGNAILDLVECVAHADTIRADASTQKLTVINSVYTTLASAAQVTNVITTQNPMSDPVQYVRQRYLDIVFREPDPAGHYYWADLLLSCDGNTACVSEQQAALGAYLANMPPPKFSISGRVTDETGSSIAAVSISLRGSQSVTTQTDSDGNFAFANLATSGSYTVTPAKNHYTFQPQSFITPSSNQVVGFVGNLEHYAISGRVFASTGRGLEGATVELSGSENARAISDANGDYSFPNLPAGGNYTVTVSRRNYFFSAPTQSVLDLSFTSQLVFEGTLQNYTISGRAKTPGGIGITGATMNLSGSQTESVLTDSSGAYSFMVPGEGNYTVNVSRANYAFSVPSRSFANLSSNQTSDFTGTFLTYTISGQVTNLGGRIITMTMSGSQNGVTQTDSNGLYSFANLPAGENYTITPTRACSDFTSPNRTFDDLNANQTLADFTVNSPLLLTEENTGFAIALGSVTFRREPFNVVNTFNFSSDSRSRISLFLSNLQLTSCEDASVVTVQGEDSQHNLHQLPVEFLGKVPNVDSLRHLIVKLPGYVAAGDLMLTVRIQGVASNQARVQIQ